MKNLSIEKNQRKDKNGEELGHNPYQTAAILPRGETVKAQTASMQNQQWKVGDVQRSVMQGMQPITESQQTNAFPAADNVHLPELYGQQRGHQGRGGLEVVQEQDDSRRHFNPRRTRATRWGPPLLQEQQDRWQRQQHLRGVPQLQRPSPLRIRTQLLDSEQPLANREQQQPSRLREQPIHTRYPGSQRPLHQPEHNSNHNEFINPQRSYSQPLLSISDPTEYARPPRTQSLPQPHSDPTPREIPRSSKSSSN